MAKAVLENVVPTVILASQFQVVAGKFHSLPLERLEVKEMSLMSIVLMRIAIRYAIWV